MDLNYSVEEAAFRDEVREWLRATVPEDLRHKVASYEDLTREDLLRWHRILADKGWVAPEWPVEWGGTGWNVVQRYIFEEECGFAGTPPLVPFGLRMCAPVLLHSRLALPGGAGPAAPAGRTGGRMMKKTISAWTPSTKPCLGLNGPRRGSCAKAAGGSRRLPAAPATTAGARSVTPT